MTAAGIAIGAGWYPRVIAWYTCCTIGSERAAVAPIAAHRGDVRVIECGRDRERIRWNAMAQYTLRRGGYG